MHGAYLKRKGETAKHCGGRFRGSPPQFAAAVPSSSKPAHNLYEVANAIDSHPRKRSTRVPAMWTYRCLYQWLSNAATHAGLHAVERFTVAVEGRAAFVIEPEPLSGAGRRHYVMVAGQLGELAREVFAAFDLDSTELDATGVGLEVS
jgi:hypothetical protein